MNDFLFSYVKQSFLEVNAGCGVLHCLVNLSLESLSWRC